MKLTWTTSLALVAALALTATACSKDAPEAPAEAPADPAAKVEALKKAYAQLPANFDSKDNAFSEDKAALGRMLYYENRLSINEKLSCNTCHQLDAYGVDGEPTSPGHEGKRGTRNSPTVYNAAGHFSQFWDGREPDVEAQAKGPVLNPVEMGMPDAETVVKKLKAIPGYVELFTKVFGGDDPVTYDNAAKAIGAFERRLVTRDRFDKWLGGDDKALTEAEIEGFVTFNEVGCMTCHNGALLGGTTYQKLGAVKPWPTQDDLGRFDATKKDEDKGLFKVPSLRNVAKTGPYFHDGSTKELAEAVKLMAHHQLGKDLDEAQIKSIVAFLEALTGEVPADYIAKPELPKAAAAEPAPADPTPAPAEPAPAEPETETEPG